MARLLLRDLTPGTNYKIQLRAVEGDSVSEWSRLFDLPVTIDSTPPDTPAWSAQPVVVDGDTFVATWVALDTGQEQNKDLDHYEVEFSDGNIAVVIRTNNTSYTLTYDQNRINFGSASATINARVRSVDAVGNASPWNTSEGDTNPAPSPVNSITVTPLYDAIDVKWDAGTLPDDFKEYVVQVSTTSASSGFATVFTGSAPQYTHASTSYSADHWFRVYVRDKFGTLSSAVTSTAVQVISPFGADTTPPAVPTALAASIVNDDNGLGATATVTWNQAQPAENDLSGFYIRYRKVGDTVWSQSDVNAEGAFDTGTSYNTTLALQRAYTNYEFQIRSYDFTGNESAWSATATGTSPSNTAPGQVTGVTSVPSRDSITYTWDASPEEDLATYEAQIATDTGFTTNLVTFKTGTAAALQAGGLNPSTTYYFRVRAVDNGGLNGTYSATDTETTLGEVTLSDLDGVSIDYLQSRGLNLVANGSGFLLSNYNFSTATFDPTERPEGASGSFVYDTINSNETDEFIVIDPERKYRLSFYAKQLAAGEQGHLYSYIKAYDIDKLVIFPYSYARVTGSVVTTLAAPLNPGDTTITLTDATGWYDGATGHQRSIGFYDYADSTGYVYPAGTYTRNYIFNGAWPENGITGNVITLTTTYSGPARPAGTPVGNMRSGSSYPYVGAVNDYIPESWTKFSDEIGGVKQDGEQAAASPVGFPPGTVYAQIGFLTNRDSPYAGGLPNSRHAIANVAFTDLTASNIPEIDEALVTANGKNKIVFSTSDATGTTGYVDGDVWFKTLGSDIIGQWEFVSGAWQSRALSDSVISSLNVGKLVSGSLSAAVITVDSTGAVESSNYISGSSGFRLDSTGLEVNDGEVKASALRAAVLGSSTGIIDIGSGAALRLNGGYIKSNTYTGTNQASNPSGAGFYLGDDGLRIDSGIVSASALTTGTISGTKTITLSGPNASIEGTGFTLSGDGIDVTSGTIAGSALEIQNSPNIVPAPYSSFEVAENNAQSIYSSENMLWSPNLVGRFGTKSIGTIFSLASQNAVFYNARSSTDYNIPVTAGEKYIFSSYVWVAGTAATPVTMMVKWDNGTTSVVGTPTLTTSMLPEDAVRVSAVLTVPAGVTGCLVYWETGTYTVTGGGFNVDGVQIEEQVGNLTTPSPWKPGGVTEIDGGMISTGSIRSNTTLDINGISTPTWMIDVDGTSILGNTWLRGEVVVGYDAEEGAGTNIQSYNYVENNSGWKIGSDGLAEFRNVKVGSFPGLAIEPSTVTADVFQSTSVLSSEIVVDGSIRTTGEMGEDISIDSAGFHVIGAYQVLVTNTSLTSNTVTITTAENHGFSAGNKVALKGVGSPYDGTYTIASTPTSTTFTYALTNADIASAAASGLAKSISNNSNVTRPVLIDFPTDGTSPNIISGTLSADTLSVNEGATFRGQNNLELGAEFIIASLILAPKAPPVISHHYYDRTLTGKNYDGYGVTKVGSTLYVLSQDSNNIRVYRYDANDGTYLGTDLTIVREYGQGVMDYGGLLFARGLEHNPVSGNFHIMFTDIPSGRTLTTRRDVVRTYDSSWNDLDNFTVQSTTASPVTWAGAFLGWDHISDRPMYVFNNGQNTTNSLRYCYINLVSGIPDSATGFTNLANHESVTSPRFIARVNDLDGTVATERIIVKSKGYGSTTEQSWRVFNSTPSLITAECWPAAYENDTYAGYYDTTTNKINALLSGSVIEYQSGDSNWSDNNNFTDTRWVGYSWYDSTGTTHETNLSPRAQVAIIKRAAMKVTVSAIPFGSGETPDAARIYVAEGDVEPALDPVSTAWHLRTTVQYPNTVGTIAPVASPSGSQPLSNSSNTFTGASSNPGQIISTSGKSYWKGDDTAKFDRLLVDSDTDATSAAGNEPALRVGDPAGSHLRIDGNEIMSMNDDSTQGPLWLNRAHNTFVERLSVLTEIFDTTIFTGRTEFQANSNDFVGAPNTTSGANANLNTSVGNRVRVVTSLSEYKLEQEPITLEEASGLLDVTPKTWYDRMEHEEADGDTSALRRIPGVVAEDVEQHVPMLALYNNEELQGVAYDRMPAALLVIIKDQQKRIKNLESRIDSITKKSDS